jgi:hypothetical protein
MYIAVMGFTTGSQTFKAGDKVPKNLIYNADRLKRGLIKEAKVIEANETKVIKNDSLHSDNNERKSKNSGKSKKQ